MKPRLFHLVAQARQNLFRSADRVFSTGLEVSGTQVVALFAIQSEEGCQLKDLTAQLQLKNSAITGLVSRMEENGLIERRPCEQDGRSSRLYLSDKGREVVAQAQPLLARVNAQLTKGFTNDELAVVARFLQHAASINFSTESTK
ncbi:MarR family winged helix-turn-helix transcriptional regulator [Piscinibacter sp. HJYY11]|uniref:MarR family winged helix-turn-helix transcriptional regulator n=1 Tax=Piscinibacter sp. HJYY11 TaxID=2801333 RepID=UPI00191EB2A0|nr:MarR family transcriptional regulator [Piscinibacter sp. HJYY11]MBL0729874.1 MarR family transcriptional regulator [Piscinibacter sp. HJYY11]